MTSPKQYILEFTSKHFNLNMNWVTVTSNTSSLETFVCLISQDLNQGPRRTCAMEKWSEIITIPSSTFCLKEKNRLFIERS